MMHQYHVTCGVLKKTIMIEEESTLSTLKKEIANLFHIDRTSVKALQAFDREWDDWLDIDDNIPQTMSKLKVVLDSEKPQDSTIEGRIESDQPVSLDDGDYSTESPTPAKPNWPSPFLVPSLPYDVEELLRKNDTAVFSRRYSKKNVHALFEKMITYTLYPSAAQYSEAARALVCKYPVLKDKAGNSTGFDTWKESLKNKFKHERAPLTNDVVQKRKQTYGHPKDVKNLKNDHTSDSLPVKLFKRDTIKATVMEEDSTSINKHLKDLKDLAKRRNPDQDIVADKLERTRAYRTTFIAEHTVKEVLDHFPILRQENQILKEVEESFGTRNIYSRLRSTMHTFHVTVLQMANKMKACHGLLEMHRAMVCDGTDEKEIKELTITTCCLLLPLLMGEKPEYIYWVDTDPITSTPCLVLKGDTCMLKTADIEVLLDGVCICSPPTVPMGLAVMFASYYLYGVEYPKPVRNTLMYLQQYIAALGRDAVTPLRVQRYVNQVHNA